MELTAGLCSRSKCLDLKPVSLAHISSLYHKTLIAASKITVPGLQEAVVCSSNPERFKDNVNPLHVSQIIFSFTYLIYGSLYGAFNVKCTWCYDNWEESSPTVEQVADHVGKGQPVI